MKRNESQEVEEDNGWVAHKVKVSFKQLKQCRNFRRS